MDEEEKVARLLRELGLELPEVEDEAEDEPPLSFDDLGEDGQERKPRDWRAAWDREWGDDN